jgi:Protein of unknown function (DUF3592)
MPGSTMVEVDGTVLRLSVSDHYERGGWACRVRYRCEIETDNGPRTKTGEVLVYKNTYSGLQVGGPVRAIYERSRPDNLILQGQQEVIRPPLWFVLFLMACVLGVLGVLAFGVRSGDMASAEELSRWHSMRQLAREGLVLRGLVGRHIVSWHSDPKCERLRPSAVVKYAFRTPAGAIIRASFDIGGPENRVILVPERGTELAILYRSDKQWTIL